MKEILKYTFIIFSLVSIGCKATKGKEKFQAIQKFMLENYAFDIANSDMLILFMPGNQCIKCLDYKVIDSIVKDQKYKIVTDADTTMFRKYSCCLIFDATSALMHLKENKFSNTIWYIKNNNVDSITSKIPLNTIQLQK